MALSRLVSSPSSVPTISPSRNRAVPTYSFSFSELAGTFSGVNPSSASRPRSASGAFLRCAQRIATGSEKTDTPR